MIQALLEPGEIVLWSGQPSDAVRPRASKYLLDLPIFSIIALLVFREAPGGWIKTLAIVGIVVGLTVLVDLRDPWRRHSTWYYLTNRRAIRMQDTLTGRVAEVALYRLTSLSASEGGDRIGTVWCLPLDSQAWPKKSRRNRPTPLFRMIVEPKRVLTNLLEAKDEILAPSAGRRTG